ncbi:hypothetical protein [Parabacteroides sp. AF48-14]|uniref:DUF7666 domain-containing protein n=1 Tax=Parabacteroides sp. AF48-14 TaxID=2292052 RepID=UPI0018F756CF|nr:hypothetical protein [Parabacteroides sp. AF48-14]
MIKGYKGFDKELKCRNFQYKTNDVFEEEGEIKACSKGFHFCENPLDVFNYYPPSDSRYCEVDGDGKIDKDNNDSKVACSKLHIHTEIGLKGIISAGVKFILDKVDWNNCKETNTGYLSAATNTGDRSAAIVEGKDSIAIITGYDSKAKGEIGCWIVLTERGEWNGQTYPILDVKAFKVDDDIIKSNTFYKLVNGKPIEVE